MTIDPFYFEDAPEIDDLDACEQSFYEDTGSLVEALLHVKTKLQQFSEFNDVIQALDQMEPYFEIHTDDPIANGWVGKDGRP